MTKRERERLFTAGTLSGYRGARLGSSTFLAGQEGFAP